MDQNKLKELKNGDVVQVKVSNKWCNGIVMSITDFNNSYMFKSTDIGVYVHYFKGDNEFGDQSYFYEGDIREYNQSSIDKKVIKSLKELVNRL